MTIVRPVFTANGHKRSRERLQLPATSRGALPSGTAWSLVSPMQAVTPDHTWMLSAAKPALLWDTGTQAPTSSTALDLANHAYLIFALENGDQLYAVPQESWASVSSASKLCPLAWVDAHHDLVPRLSAAGPAVYQVWLTSPHFWNIERFDVSGNGLRPVYNGNGLNAPHGLAQVGSQVWVANSGNGTISRFNFDGSSAGAPFRDDSLTVPESLKVVGDLVWVTNADLSNNTISRFNFDGTSYSGGPIHSASANAPKALCMVGNVAWVTDLMDGRIRRYQTDGTFLGEISYDASNGLILDMIQADASTVWGTFIGTAEFNGVYLIDINTYAESLLTHPDLYTPQGLVLVPVHPDVPVTGNEIWIVDQFNPGGSPIVRFLPDKTNLTPDYITSGSYTYGLATVRTA